MYTSPFQISKYTTVCRPKKFVCENDNQCSSVSRTQSKSASVTGRNGSRDPGSSGCDRTVTDGQAWRSWSGSWRAAALETCAAGEAPSAGHIVACQWSAWQQRSSPTANVVSTRQWCLGYSSLIAPVQAAGDENLDHRLGGIHGRVSDGLSQLSQLIVVAPANRSNVLWQRPSAVKSPRPGRAWDDCWIWVVDDKTGTKAMSSLASNIPRTLWQSLIHQNW